ncbi:hypothetical protein HanXRQr2_Chr01g0012231 [Helianthus annuus]|uniref:Uncharacterized protein n=1 Tax=Helianthus annuus TaxID=4232 RepID=A0A9K3JTU2_HELAN|nr:hypothetical protein HanXRQr2_Chr01g0012231 [Helianthus annuus]
MGLGWSAFEERDIQLLFTNYATVGIGEPLEIRVLSGAHFLEVLPYLLPLCNEDTSPVMPALIFSGCDKNNTSDINKNHKESSK